MDGEHKRQPEELAMQAEKPWQLIGMIPYANKDSILKRSLGPSSKIERALKALSMAGASQPAAIEDYFKSGKDTWGSGIAIVMPGACLSERR